MRNDAILTCLFCLVECAVYFFHHCYQVASVGWIGHHANTYSRARDVPTKIDPGFLDCMPDALSHFRCSKGVSLRQQNDELVPAIPGDYVSAPDGVSDSTDDLHQKPIPSVVAITVVDRFRDCPNRSSLATVFASNGRLV